VRNSLIEKDNKKEENGRQKNNRNESNQAQDIANNKCRKNQFKMAQKKIKVNRKENILNMFLLAQSADQNQRINDQ